MVVMLNSILGYSGTVQTFSDVSKSEYPWAYNDISALAGQGIVKGYADMSFRPQSIITRAETAALITRIDLSPMEIK
jgi:hypothetical protein